MRPLHLSIPTQRPCTLLCLGAHSDDIEIGCAGTLLTMLRSRADIEVHWVVFGATEEREEEARHSAAVMLKNAARSSVDVMAFRDGFFPYEGSAIKERFEDLKARVQPDLIFTLRDADRHQDHRLIAELTWNTFRDHLILEYEIPKYDGDLGCPNVFVPIDEMAKDGKIDLLETMFQSQQKKRWFTQETFLALLRLRGIECASPTGLAEGFYSRKILLGLPPTPA